MYPVKTLRLAMISFNLAMGLAGPLKASSFTPLSLPTLNVDIRGWSDGAAYNPLYPTSSQTLGGVAFNFNADGSGNTAFWGGILNIGVGVYGVTDVYTLINSAWGVDGTGVGSISFFGDLGATYTVSLIEGVNVRDHFLGGFTNTTSDPSVSQSVWGTNTLFTAHLDMQDFMLPTAFSTQTLLNIQFNSYGDGPPWGTPFIAGATVASADTSSVPEASAVLPLLTLTLICLGVAKRKLTS